MLVPNQHISTVRWTRVDQQNVCEVGLRFLQIMQQMNHENYKTSRPERVCRRMPMHNYYLGQGDSFEVAIAFVRRARPWSVLLRSLGFVGELEPDEALDVAVLKARSFLQSEGTDRFVGVQPDHMDDPKLIELFTLVPLHPHLDLHGGHRTSRGLFWRIRLRQTHHKPGQWKGKSDAQEQ